MLPKPCPIYHISSSLPPPRVYPVSYQPRVLYSCLKWLLTAWASVRGTTYPHFCPHETLQVKRTNMQKRPLGSTVIRGLMEEGEAVLVSCGRCNKLPQTWWFISWGSFFSHNPEARSLKSRGQQNLLPLKSPGDNLFSPFPTSSGSRQSLACGSITPVFVSFLTLPFPLFCVSYKDIWHCIGLAKKFIQVLQPKPEWTFWPTEYLRSMQGLIPGSGRSPGVGNSNPFQYSCMGNPKDRGDCRPISKWGCKESDMTEHTHVFKVYLDNPEWFI